MGKEILGHVWRLNSFLSTLQQNWGGDRHGDVQRGVASVWEPVDGLPVGSVGWHVAPAARRRASTRHIGQQETSVLDHWFIVVGARIQTSLLSSLTVCPRVWPSSSRGGNLHSDQMFSFPKAIMPWKVEFTYKSCSSVQSVQLLIVAVADLLTSFEDLNSSKLPSVPLLHTAAFPQDPKCGLHFKLRSGISCLVSRWFNRSRNTNEHVHNRVAYLQKAESRFSHRTIKPPVCFSWAYVWRTSDSAAEHASACSSSPVVHFSAKDFYISGYYI